MEQNNESLQNQQQQPMAIAMGAVSNDIPASSKVKEDVTPATIAAVAVAVAPSPSLTTSMSIDTASSSDPSYILNNGSTTTTTTTPTSGGAANNKNKRKRPIPSPTASLQDATSMDLGDNDNEDDQEQEQSLLSRIGKDGEPLSDKKLRRLEKNRLSARECRRRKREATESMQRQINILEGENLRLRLQLQVRKEYIIGDV